MTNGMRSAPTMKVKPSVGDTVRTAAGERYIVAAVGMKYVNAYPAYGNPNHRQLLNMRDIFPDSGPPAPPPPPPEVEE